MKFMYEIKFKKYLSVSLLFFFISIIMGGIFGGLVGDIGKITFLDRNYYDYFVHNLKACLILILLGIISYGTLTLIPLLYNGFVLGMAFNFMTYKYRLLNVFLLFFHGIFEIPALIISLYLGKVISFYIVDTIISKKIDKNKVLYSIKINLLLLLLMVFFLFVASIIESLPK